MRSYTFAAARKTHSLLGRRFYINPVFINFAAVGNASANFFYIRTQLWSLSYHGAVYIPDFAALL